MNILVLGIGNILLQDEGIGVRVVEDLEKQYTLPEGVEVVDGGTSGMDLLDTVLDRDHLIVVDAVHTGDPPGTLVKLQGDEVPVFFRSKISPHQLGLSDLLANVTLMEALPARMTLIGVVPQSMETGIELTELLETRRPDLLAMVLEALNESGVELWSRGRNGTTG